MRLSKKILIVAAGGLLAVWGLRNLGRIAADQNGFIQIVLGGLLAVIILVAIAIMFSTRFNVVLTLTFCVGVFLMGLISDYVFSKFSQSDNTILSTWAAKIWHIIVPNLQVFWISDAIYEGSDIPGSYIGITAVYAIAYTMGILMFAIALFQRRQVG